MTKTPFANEEIDEWAAMATLRPKSKSASFPGPKRPPASSTRVASRVAYTAGVPPFSERTAPSKGERKTTTGSANRVRYYVPVHHRVRLYAVYELQMFLELCGMSSEDYFQRDDMAGQEEGSELGKIIKP